MLAFTASIPPLGYALILVPIVILAAWFIAASRDARRDIDELDEDGN